MTRFLIFLFGGFSAFLAAYAAPLISRSGASRYLALDRMWRVMMAANLVARSRFNAFADRARRHGDYVAGHFCPG